MGAVREKLKWADGKLVKEIIEKQVYIVLCMCLSVTLYDQRLKKIHLISPFRLRQCWVPRLKRT